MYIKLASIFFMSAFGLFFNGYAAQKAVTTVSIADLVGQSIGREKYSTLALFAHPVAFCPRMHQLLYNELVTIVEEKADEVCILINGVFYEIAGNAKPQNLYWTLKKNVTPLETLKKRGIQLNTLPPAIDFDKRDNMLDESVVSLTAPFHDLMNNRTYSAGTRFIRAPSASSKDRIAVFVLDHTCSKNSVIHLPRAFCLSSEQLTDENKRKSIFLKILQSWAHQPNGFIPYVWGGCSFTTLAHGRHFISNQIDQARAYTPSQHCKPPYTGMDCAGLITRAAQLSGIPYFFKNTATLANHLKEITHLQDIQPADLIWFPGHVMVISSCKPARIIEARAYGQGYGKIHELPLQAVFKGVDSLEKLWACVTEKKSLSRLAQDGTIAHSVTKIKILRI